MKKYLKTMEQVIQVLKDGKTVEDRDYKYRLISGIICSINKEEERRGSHKWIVGDCVDAWEKPYITEPEIFKLEVGKFYKTRGGKKVIILADTRKEKFFVAQIGKWTNPYTVRKNGCIYEKNENDFDLVALWEEIK